MKSGSNRFANMMTIIVSDVIKLRIAPDEIALFFRDTPVFVSCDPGSFSIKQINSDEVIMTIGRYFVRIHRSDLSNAVAVVAEGPIINAVNTALSTYNVYPKGKSPDV